MKWDNSTLHQMKGQIMEELNHPYLAKKMDPPNIDDHKLSLLLSILHAQNLSKGDLRKYATAVMLVQIALDTHDLVENGDGKSRQRRQLTVLAGDFYSGLYYRILSLVPNVQLVKDLADGIKIANECKIRVYNKEVSSLQDFMGNMQTIETIIYEKLAAFFQDAFWQSASKDWLHLQQLKKRRENYIHYIRSHLLSKTDFKAGLTVEHWFQRYFQDVYERLKRSVQGMPDMYNLLGPDFFLEEGAKRSFI